MFRSREIVADIMAEIAKAFSGETRMKDLRGTLEDLIDNRLDTVVTQCQDSFVGPPTVYVYPDPPAPPLSRELLRKYICHVSALHGKSYFVSFQKSDIQFTDDEMTELLTLESEANADRR